MEQDIHVCQIYSMAWWQQSQNYYYGNTYFKCKQICISRVLILATHSDSIWNDNTIV